MKRLHTRNQQARRGAITILAAFLSIVLISMVAFCVDVGYVLSAKEELQRSADSSALAAPNVTVNLVEPGTLYGDRVNEFDFRLAKILKFGRTRTNVGFDIYNILNAAPVLSYNQAFSPATAAWLTPTAVLQPRFWKFSVQVDF